MNDENSQTLCIKIVSADYYLTKPIAELDDPCYSGFKSSSICNVPIIRIFGPTSEGVKTCAHIHGVFPYLFIPNWNDEIAEKDLYQFAAKLDKAINTSFAYSSSKTSHVHRISKVSGRPFYGYYEEEKQFLKIEFYNPAIIKRASDLLQNGVVTGQSFQPYEAHIPFILQFFIDNNLYGMNYVVLRSYQTRIVADKEVNYNMCISGYVKQSYCALEIDASASDIINSHKNSENMPNNPGLAFIWEEEKKRRRIQRRDSEITPNASQSRPNKPPTRTELYFETKLAEKLHPLKHLSNVKKVKCAVSTKENSVMNASQESEMNSSYGELNSQGRSILSLLEQLVDQRNTNKKSPIHSPTSSPSVVYSDDDAENDLSNALFLRSQPVLQLHAEDDSILGDKFSDEEIDDEDHFILSQSLAHGRTTKSFSSSESDSENFADIPQVDGATVPSPKSLKYRRKKDTKSAAGKKEIRAKRTYNLRSRPKSADVICESERMQPNDSKISPKKQYPQLQIDTQKSPKMMAARQSKIASGSEVACSEVSESEVVTDVSEDGRKSESKRLYPQLEINVRRSPKMGTKTETDNFSNNSNRLKKRKIDFDSSETSSGNAEIFDVSSITAKWKKRRLKARKSPDFHDSVAERNFENRRFPEELGKFTEGEFVDTFEDIFDNDDERKNTTYTVCSDISSQKLSLKINLNSTDPEARLLYDHVRLKVPVIRLTRISEKDLKTRSDRVDLRRENDEKTGDVLIANDNEREIFADIEDKLKSRRSENEGGDARNVGVRISSYGGTLRRKNMGRAIGKCKVINVCRSIQNRTRSEYGRQREDISMVCEKSTSSTSENDHSIAKGCKGNPVPDRNSSKRKKLGIRMGARSKLCECYTSQSNIPFSMSRADPEKINEEATGTSITNILIPSDDIKNESDVFHEPDLDISDFEIKDEQMLEKESERDFKIEKSMKYCTNESSNLELQKLNFELKKVPDPGEEFDCSPKIELPLCESGLKASSGIADTVICSSIYDPKLDSQIKNDYECENGGTWDWNPLMANSNLLYSRSELNMTSNKMPAEQIDAQEMDAILRTPGKNVSEFRSQRMAGKLNGASNEDTIICSNAVEIQSQEIIEKSNDPANMDTVICTSVSEELSHEIMKTNYDAAAADTNIYSDFVENQSQDVLENENDPADMDTIIRSFVNGSRSENKLKNYSSSVNLSLDFNTEATQLSSPVTPVNFDLPSELNCNKAKEKWNHSTNNAADMNSIITSWNSEEEKRAEPDSFDKKHTQDSDGVAISDENYDTDIKNSNGDDRSNISPCQTDTSVDTFTCSMNSEDDLIFSEINLPPYVIQKSTRNDGSHSAKTSVVNEEKKFEEPLTELKQTSVVENNESDTLSCGTFSNEEKKSTADTVICEDSAWESSEIEEGEDRIQSFYIDESLLDANTTLFHGDKSSILKDSKSSPVLKFSSPETNKASESTKKDQNSSPILKMFGNADEPINDERSSPLFGKSASTRKDDEISSFYNVESPIDSVVSIGDKLSDVESDLCSQNKLDPEPENQDSSPTSTVTGSQSPVMLHSTPQHGKSKKSPSPTYTPILKKLMLKKISSGERSLRRRISSQRFQSEPFLKKINEEDEAKLNEKDQSTSLPFNVPEEKSSAEDSRKINNSRSSSCGGASGQIDVTLANTYGFQMGLENLRDVKADLQYQYITVMSMELFAETRHDLRPDPEYDAISCLFYSVFNDTPNNPSLISGVVIVDTDSSKLDIRRFNCEKIFVNSEIELFDYFITIFRKWDPDILLGYEIEMLSWGYFIQRGQYLNRNCDEELSRVKELKTKDRKNKTVVEDSDYSSDMKLVGRIVLNVWRLMRHEIALQSYTFENIIFHVLHQRVPQHSFQSLTQWYKNPLRRWIVIDYYLFRTENNILLLQQLDFFGRTSELAKLFGILFYEVLSRGSQFRVESMMLRLAKTKNFVAVSPNPKQRAAMRAPESLPLIMEPESKFYTDPVIVLDFQSLYPSIIIAYNYCFSTCLGRVEHFVKEETFEFGCIQHTVPAELLLKLESSLNFSPCGVAFVNKNIRVGILPSMLEEILETRLMVKQSMKENKTNSILQRVLHARQLGLKLIANVTYGYTSANFSGRMPCIEVGDSVVSKGRETLERAIELISKTEKWAAKVVYGDTDSVFVMVPNRTKEEAFRIGNEIVDAVTNDNPKPVKLKLEKVYYPCILQTKKRYVGYMYESVDQKEPVYDAKGIETVRRDGCPAISKILEKSLKLLFQSKDVDVVKRYVQRQFSKLVSSRISLQELTFAREYRGMNNYRPAACVPALQIARQALLKDRRSEPRVKERVRYVLVAGPPGVPLIRLVRTPEQYFENPGSVVNVEYYITRAIIPALERCFSLMNVNVQSWYTELPKKKQIHLPVENDFRNKLYKKKTISHYFTTSKCIICDEIAISGICQECQKKPPQLAVSLANMINSWQRKYNYTSKVCRSCCGRSDEIDCISLDCPVYYIHHRSKKDVEQVPYIEELQHKYLHVEPKKSKVNSLTYHRPK